MNETDVTVVGFVGTKPELRDVAGTVVAGFRVGSTPRFYSQRDGAWGDRETNWFTVNAWRTLGENCAESLRVGEPVIVRGRLRTQVWTDEHGATRTTYSVDAVSVGHDLTRGTSVYLSNKGVAAQPGEEDRELAKANSEWDVPMPDVTSTGHFAPAPVDVSGLVEEPEAVAGGELVEAPF